MENPIGSTDAPPAFPEIASAKARKYASPVSDRSRVKRSKQMTFRPCSFPNRSNSAASLGAPGAPWK